MKLLVLAFLFAIVMVIAASAAQAKCIEEAPYYFGRGEPGSAIASLFLLPGATAIGIVSLGATVRYQDRTGEVRYSRAICMPVLLAGHVVAWRSVEARTAIERGVQ